MQNVRQPKAVSRRSFASPRNLDRLDELAFGLQRLLGPAL